MPFSYKRLSLKRIRRPASSSCPSDDEAPSAPKRAATIANSNLALQESPALQDIDPLVTSKPVNEEVILSCSRCNHPLLASSEMERSNQWSFRSKESESPVCQDCISTPNTSQHREGSRQMTTLAWKDKDAPQADLPLARRGLFELTKKPPSESPSDIRKDIEVVAVHGLMGDPYNTWTEDGKLWLRDFLPSQLPTARIFTFGYNSSVAFSQSVAGIEDFAVSLLTRLDLERPSDEEQSRPILFICHSLGGLVVKKALVLSNQQIYGSSDNICKRTAGVAFLGVPHRGAAIARIGHFFADVLKKATVGRTTNAQLTADLKQGSRALIELSSQAVQPLQKSRILSFYERERTMGELIVDSDSAKLNIPGERAIPVDANHKTICRFSSADDQNYKLVGGSIAKLVKEIIVNEAQDLRVDRLFIPPTTGYPFSEIEVTCMQALYRVDCKAMKRKIPRPTEPNYDWILQHVQFQLWKFSESRNLIIYGDPGCGKTVLARELIDALELVDVDSHILFFFFDRTSVFQRTAADMMRSLLHQFFEREPSLIRVAVRHFQTKSPRIVEELDVLWTIFEDCFKDRDYPIYRKVICIVDGLNDCDAPGHILRMINNLVGRGVFKFILTSWPGFARSYPWIHSICVNSDNNKVARYIEHRIAQMQWSQNLSDKRRDTLFQRLVSNAAGTFLWVSVVLDLLQDLEETSAASVDRVLKEIPSALEDTYSYILGTIPQHRRPRSKQMFEILIAALRPLAVQELNAVWAARVSTRDETHIASPDIPATSDYDELGRHLQTDMERTIGLLCGPFIRITNGYVCLIHPTATEFLVSRKGRESKDDNWFSLEFRSANAFMAENCVKFLHLMERHQNTFKGFLGLAKETKYLSSEFPPVPWLRYRLKQFNEKYPFLDYALENWSHHLRYEQDKCTELIDDLSDLAIALYRTEFLQLQWWLSVDWQIYSFSGVARLTDFPFQMIGLCAYNGHHLLVQRMVKDGASVSSKGSPYDYSPLHMAILGRQPAMLKWLIKQGADLDAENSSQETPLLAACNKGDIELLETLAKHAADLEARDGQGNTALMRSVQWLSLAHVNALLREGAFVDTINEQRETPVHIAASLDDVPMAELLIGWGAQVNMLDSSLRTPLHMAVDMGSIGMMNLLLGYRASTSFRDRRGWVALDCAIHSRNEEAVRILLDNGADPHDVVVELKLSSVPEDAEEFNMLDFDSSGALLTLDSPEGYNTEYRINPMLDQARKDFPYQLAFISPLLFLATEAGKEDQVSYLLDNGMNPDTRSRINGMNPLDIAVRNRSESIVAVLIERKANLQGGQMHGPSPLSLAIHLGHTRIARLLLQGGASPFVPTCCPKHLPFNIAVSSRDKDILESMLFAIRTSDPPVSHEFCMILVEVLWLISKVRSASDLLESPSDVCPYQSSHLSEQATSEQFYHCEIQPSSQVTRDTNPIATSAEYERLRRVYEFHRRLTKAVIKEFNQVHSPQRCVVSHWLGLDADASTAMSDYYASSCGAQLPSKSSMDESEALEAMERADSASQSMSDVSEKSFGNAPPQAPT